MTANEGAEEEAPKKRTRKPKERPEPEAVSADNDGPGVYECIKKCIGRREWRVGDQGHFDRNPGLHYFKKVKG